MAEGVVLSRVVVPMERMKVLVEERAEDVAVDEGWSRGRNGQHDTNSND
jgi:hypothetical protein